MKKAILFPLIFAGSAAAVGTGTYFIYSTSTGEQTGTGVIISNNSQTSPRKDLSGSVDETKKQDQNQNQEKIQEPERNVETDLSGSVEETPKQDQNQEKIQESEKNVETDLSGSVEETKKQDQNQNQEEIQEPEKNVETDLSGSVDETPKQNQNQEKIQESEKNVEKEFPTLINKTENEKEKENQQSTHEPEKNMQKDNNQSIRLGFWNVKDYTNKINSKKQTNTAKTYALANVINSSGSDVVGLAEITTTGDGADIVKELEKLNPAAGWKQMTTSKYGKTNQEEKYSFLYKSSLLEMINFEVNSNPYLIQDGTKLTWTRPVAAVKFKTKTNIKNDFTLAIGHFDTAGPYKKSKKNHKEEADSEASKQGQQEADEARDLANVLNEIDKKDGLNNEIIFMGDTNILTENTEKLFKSTLESYRLLLDKDEKTTLSSKNFGEYANSYDKIFYKGDLNIKNAQKYDLYSIFEKNIVNVEEYDKMRKQDKRETKYKSGDPKDIKRITGISNHTMVYFDLELSESDKN